MKRAGEKRRHDQRESNVCIQILNNGSPGHREMFQSFESALSDGDGGRVQGLCTSARLVFSLSGLLLTDGADSTGAIAILRRGNIENGQVVMNDLKYIDAVDSALLLRHGDLLYNRTNSLDLVGKVGMFRGDAELPVSFVSYLVRLRTVDQSLPSFFAYLLNTEGILGLARANAFVAIGQCNLNPTRYGMIGVAIPPKTEQAAIVAYLDDQTAKLDALTAEAQRAIDLLQERRTALISAAVTGIIDVRGISAN